MDSNSACAADRSIALGEMRVDFVIDGREVSAQAKVVEQLFPSPRVVFEVSGVPRKPQGSAETHPGPPPISIFSSPITSDGPARLRMENGVEVEVVPTPWLFNQQEDTIYLAHSPSVVFRSGNPITRLQFKILNFSNSVLHRPIAMEIAPWLLRIEPVPNLLGLEKTLRSNSGYAVTHTGTVERQDDQGFSQEEAESVLNALGKFLSFTCSSFCTVTDVVGTSADGSEAWKRWGSHSVAPWTRRRTWADITVRDSLEDIFRVFWQEYTKNRQVLERALNWYVESNQAQAMDVSIILNQVALELLTDLTVGRQPEKVPSGEWIASALKKAGIDPQIPSLCGELTTLANQKSLSHGPHALVDARNSMIHSNLTLYLPSFNAYHEVKQLGLWYVELLLLNRFQYMGEYASRLIPVQTPGDTELVPWAKSVTN